MASFGAGGATPALTGVAGAALAVPGPDRVGPVLAAALACANAALSPAVGRTALYPGLTVAWDDCCDGQVWVRLLSLVPSGNPVNSRNQGTPCGVLLWTATLGIGALRCASVVDDAGNAPSPAQLTADTNQMTADMSAIAQALQCCLAEQVNKLTMLRWDALGPDGACVGGEWMVQVLIDNCRCT